MRVLPVLAVIGAVGLGGYGVYAISNSATVVEAIIDGDTIDARVDGATTRIRLLNVDTPEIGRNGEPSECLAQEARDYLESVIPVGSVINLEFDQQKEDRYGRILAGVFHDGDLVNAEIAREGLGVAVDITPNHKFYPDVLKAEEQAKTKRIGISTLGPECYVTDSQYRKDLEDATAAIEEAEGLKLYYLSDPDEFHQAENTSKKLGATIEALKTVRSASGGQSTYQRAAFGEKLTKFINERIEEAESNKRKIDSALQAEKERQEREAEAKRIEEELRAAEERRAEAQRQAEVQRQQSVSNAPAQQSPAPARTPSVDTYTGCRAYGGNYALTSVDKKGRPYAKIDCTTKQQIG